MGITGITEWVSSEYAIRATSTTIRAKIDNSLHNNLIKVHPKLEFFTFH